MPDYWFFLSYNRIDNVSVYLRRFFEDLAREVRRLAPLSAAVNEREVGFLDELGIEPGDKWDDRLGEALQTTRTLVCLYSRGYFVSEYCGREFQLFRSRVDRGTAPGATAGSQPQVILPVLWDREERVSPAIPSALSAIQYKHGGFAEVYAHEGLLGMMKKGRRYQAEYAEFLDRFAEKVVDAARSCRLPRLPELPSLAEVPNAFGHPHRQSTASAGTDVARFIFVAGRDAECSRVKRDVQYYGNEGGRDWRPYMPEVKKAVGMISQHVAYGADLHYEVLPLGDDLVQQLEHAERNNAIVLIIVDPWSIQIECYRRYMEACDRINLSVNCGVLVVWNQDDQETQDRLDALRGAVEALFYRTGMSNTFFRKAVGSADELHSELLAAICEVRNRIHRKATLFREVIATPLPRISGPGGGVP